MPPARSAVTRNGYQRLSKSSRHLLARAIWHQRACLFVSHLLLCMVPHHTRVTDDGGTHGLVQATQDGLNTCMENLGIGARQLERFTVGNKLGLRDVLQARA